MLFKKLKSTAPSSEKALSQNRLDLKNDLQTIQCLP